MTEKNPIQEARLEFSRKTSAFYPEWSTLLSKQELERRFFDRCKRYGKESGVNLAGSPNHGEQWWIYSGASKLFSLSSSRGTSDIIEQKWMRLDTLFSWLQKDTIALLVPNDIRNANSIAALPKAFRNEVTRLEELVTKSGRNGIILIRP